ncbi:hypothetical protein CDG76_11810 [Nostoc sp. 'Peltigera membranacea cyanobiont' 210A]|uniref:hypothetical protein n=1 Tax=Nostoc sp. 'Peltigera membranacea cyanobiont' 210A TaxID=2014529 RepID=UPI000B9583F7|nr:hypothetical protein [Nostoc sp. 'Peltigera membranacea cyanobiont' 210A]OYD95620.1 hypothetical protein CDG76_11810 [Nostoc sp. 'Peltigera membranacea cyanobiont' 210A]
MSLPVTVTFMLADWIVKGLKDGTLERVGGVIREVGSKHIVTWLREQIPNNSTVNQLGELGRSVQVTSAVSILNLGVSVIGFIVIAQRLKELEQRLQQAQKVLNNINRKIDLSFYANFRAAIELANNAFTMTKTENRRNSALQAINRFLEAEHIYAEYTDIEIEQKSQIIDEYLLTLSLAYLAEARCYLELEEHDTALRRFQEGAKVLRSRIKKYIDIVLTSNPAAYLQPCYKGQIDLRRLTRIYQWSNPNLDENAVFDMQRENLFKMGEELYSTYKWVDSLPPAVLTRDEVQGGWFGPDHKDLKQEADKRLPKVIEAVESMIETHCRFKSYQTELQAISQLGISFHDWLKLTPSTEIKPDGAELMYIIPSKPLELQSSI